MTETSASASPTAEPGAPAPSPLRPENQPENPFFDWLRGLGLPRTHGWVGGVCAGLSVRMGIDPIIVRGLFVVAAILGLPALLIYAIAWALLPDVNGRILLQQLFRGRFEPAMAAILILAAVSVFPVVPWLVSLAFWPFAAVLDRWSGFWWGFGGSSVFGTVLTVVLVAGIVALVIWLAVRAAKDPRGGSESGPRRASADPAAPGPLSVEASVPDGSESTDASPGASVATADPGPEPVAAPTATDDEIAQWRAKHDEWVAQRDAWRRSRQDAERAARDRARREHEAAAKAFAAEADERRRVRRATKPRTSFVYIVATFGAALVAGATSALAALGSTGTADYAGAIGLLVGAIVVGLSMAVAGAARRRSGFLTSVAIVLVALGVIASLAAGPRGLVLGSASLGTASYDQQITQPFGTTTIQVLPLDSRADVDAGTVTVRKGSGDTSIEVHPGTTLRLTADLDAGGVSYTRVSTSSGEIVGDGVIRAQDTPDGGARFRWFARNDDPGNLGTTAHTVHLTQSSGSVFVTIYEP